MTTIYRSTVTNNFRTKNLMNFYNMVGDSADQNSIYLTFGRKEPWADNESEPGFAPPYPEDNTTGYANIWTQLLGAVKVNKSYLDAVYPRRDWGDDRYASPTVFKINEIVVVNSAPYNRTDVDGGWMVYRVVDIPEAGSCSITSIVDKDDCILMGGDWTPSMASVEPPRGRGNAVDMGDGYIWEYLYTIPADVSINRCSNEHIVVPFPDDLESEPERWGYEHNVSWYPDKYDLIYRIRAVQFRFRAYLDSLHFPEESLPGNSGFRQLAIMMNPLVKRNHPTDVDKKATGPAYKPDELEPHSGEIIYIENRQQIIRSLDQTEEINIIFDF